MKICERCGCEHDGSYGSGRFCSSLCAHHGTALKRSYEHSHKKKVICVETEVIYKSLTEASKQNGIALSNLSNCCNGKIKTCKGYHWEFC